MWRDETRLGLGGELMCAWMQHFSLISFTVTRRSPSPSRSLWRWPPFLVWRESSPWIACHRWLCGKMKLAFHGYGSFEDAFSRSASYIILHPTVSLAVISSDIIVYSSPKILPFLRTDLASSLGQLFSSPSVWAKVFSIVAPHDPFFLDLSPTSVVKTSFSWLPHHSSVISFGWWHLCGLFFPKILPFSRLGLASSIGVHYFLFHLSEPQGPFHRWLIPSPAIYLQLLRLILFMTTSSLLLYISSGWWHPSLTFLFWVFHGVTLCCSIYVNASPFSKALVDVDTFFLGSSRVFCLVVPFNLELAMVYCFGFLLWSSCE